MREFFSQNGLLAKFLDGFSERESQILMAEKVANAIDECKPLVIEAPTGVGKTFAYLLPIFQKEKKAIISTATIVLQHQLFEKDIPFTAQLFNRDYKVEILKGRQNYLCLLRFFNEKNKPGSNREKHLYNTISSWIEYTEKGDFSEIEGLSLSDISIRKINADKNFCTGRKCPHYKECYFYRARKRAVDADIVLVNHHLFVSDLAVKSSDFGSILPLADVVVIDEAHKFETIASIQFGETFSLRMLTIFFNQLPSELRLKYVKNFEYLQNKENLELENIQTARIDKKQKKYFYKLKETMGFLKEDLKLIDEDDFDLKTNLIKRADRFIVFVELIDNPDFVSFYEYEDKSVVFKNIPLNVSDKLSNLFSVYYPCVIFTSATLAVNNSLDFFKKSVGVEYAESFVLPSVFNYKENTLLYVPLDIPFVDEPDFVEKSVEEIYDILKRIKGKTFLLCTSLKNVKLFANALRNKVDLNILVQGEDSNSFLIERFRESQNSVLIGSFSFWEGIDIKGEDLSCVIIDRLPFNRPDDPVFSEKSSRIKNSFKDYAIPLSVLQLKQGMGRLIRDEKDKGIFIILDKRIQKKWYGKFFLKSLFNFEVVNDKERVFDFIDKKLINL
ncbi:ATP-dependent DNA helicase DinG [Thermotomaculum hydrothermale]|uniref:DNA 5'-3' helicase n=1 Tax=Thermotomaculum hydrothermale TaxID=981385 RepID=A0A7R6PND2_9BACT|nr:ATP-dependent DNA helicase [Thermotomaculum hydrothermale]BBB32768.1 ATP-dependent DNA helicase DinG [Thermotomaculum hydrothermale]